MDITGGLVAKLPGSANPSSVSSFSSHMCLSPQNQLHTAIQSIENDLSQRLANARADDSWRLCSQLFGKDTYYIKSGLINVSAGWYPPGRTVRSHFCLPLMAANAYFSTSITFLSQRHYSDLTGESICLTARAMHGQYSPESCPLFIQRSTKWEFKSIQVWRRVGYRPT